MPSVIKLAG